MVDLVTEGVFTDKEINEIRTKTKELLSTKKIDRKFLAQELQRNRSNVNRFLNGEQKLNTEALKRLRKILPPDEKWFGVCPVGGGKIIDFLINPEKKKNGWEVSFKRKKKIVSIPVRLEVLLFWKKEYVVVPEEVRYLLLREFN